MSENEMAMFMREMWVDLIRGKLDDDCKAAAWKFFHSELAEGLFDYWFCKCKEGMGVDTKAEVFARILNLTDTEAIDLAHSLPDMPTDENS